MERRKIIGVAVFSAAIAGGGMAGVALGSPATSSAATASGATTTTKPGDRPTRGVGGHEAGLDAAAKAIGISTDALLTELEAGKSIADVAKAHDVSVDTVIDAMVAAAKTEFESNLRDRIADRVNGTFTRPDGPDGPGGPHRGFGVRGGFGLDAAAKALGVTTDALRADMKDGKTIADVAKDKGIATQKVIDAMVAAAKTDFDAQVKAGHLTSEQAAKIEANLTKMITNLVNGTLARPDPRGMGGGGFGGPAGRPGAGFGGPFGGRPNGPDSSTEAAPTGV
jgi:hypothetical protein